MMQAASNISVWVDGVGVLGPGLSNWPQALQVLSGNADFVAQPTVLPSPALLPPAERRRASRIIKASLAVGLEAAQVAQVDAAQLPNVFASSGGDGHNCHALCELLASNDRQVSPTRFHNSVHNAASGYWAIATGAMPPAQVVAAYDASFAVGLFEAMIQVQTLQMPVLLVAVDSEYPAPLDTKRPIADTSGLALVLSPAPTSRSLGRLMLEPACYLLDGEAPAPVWPGLDELAALCGQLPPWRGMPVLKALASAASLAGQQSAQPSALLHHTVRQTVNLPWLPGQMLQLGVEAMASVPKTTQASHV